MEFVNLHGHSVYSVKDAMAKPQDIIKAAHDLGQKAVAITDHGVMYAMVKFLRACDKQKEKGNIVKPLLGNELYYTPDRKTRSDERYHLVILARTQEGLKNLYLLSSEAGINKIKGKTKDYPTTEDEALEAYSKGLIGLSACIGGIIPKLILAGDYAAAKAKAIYFNGLFDAFYLEVQPHDIQEQLVVNAELVRMSQETGIPLAITSDYHYITGSQRKHHDILMQMGYRKPLDVDAHFRSADEMEAYCVKHGIPLSAIENTVKIADSIDYDPRPKDSMGLMPTYPCPAGYDEDTYLRKMIMDRVGAFVCDKRRKIKDPKVYIDRAVYELDVITTMGYSGYFLILWDWFDWCRKNKILMGKGRGSAAGSLVSYLLRVTTIDPIKNGYFFERFLTMERFEMPDIDSDVSKLDRPKAIQYLMGKYGVNYVAQIITFTMMKLKSTLKEAARVYALDYDEVNTLTKSIPAFVDGKEPTLEMIEEVCADPDKFVDIGTGNVAALQKVGAALKTYFDKYPQVYEAVVNLAGCTSSVGIHAGGVVVASKPLAENVPLTSGSDTAVLSLIQLPMEDLDYFNLLKIDVLGLTTLSQVRVAMDMIGLPDEWFDSEDFDDPNVYQFLREGNTTDIFQMASTGATKLLRDMHVENFEELTDSNAGNRPGPLAKNKDTGKSIIDVYIENKKNHTRTSIHPDIDPTLALTKGCILYQEQVMEISRILAGYSLGGADKRIRKTLGKKKLEMIPELKAEFLHGRKYDYDTKQEIAEASPYCPGAGARKYDLDMAEQVFDQMAEFAKYAFNKPHSGSYSALGYKTAWLSLYHPVEWAVACLYTHDKTEKIVATLTACKRRGIEILPPDVNLSDDFFTVETMADGSKAIRYGLASIKNVGKRAVDRIKRYRPYTSFPDFYARIHDTSIPKEINPVTGKAMNNPLDKTSETFLINAGAFDAFEPNRHELLNTFMINRKEKNFTLLDPNKFNRKAKLALELETMGCYVSEHPLDPFPYVDIDGADDGEYIETTGIITKVTQKKDRKGGTYATVNFEAKDGKEYMTLVFSNVYEKFKDRLKMGEIRIFCGTVNKSYNNINCTLVRMFVRKQQDKPEQEQENVYTPPVRPNMAEDFNQIGQPNSLMEGA